MGQKVDGRQHEARKKQRDLAHRQAKPCARARSSQQPIAKSTPWQEQAKKGYKQSQIIGVLYGAPDVVGGIMSLKGKGVRE